MSRNLPSASPMPDLRHPAWKPRIPLQVFAVDISFAELQTIGGLHRRRDVPRI